MSTDTRSPSVGRLTRQPFLVDQSTALFDEVRVSPAESVSV